MINLRATAGDEAPTLPKVRKPAPKRKAQKATIMDESDRAADSEELEAAKAKSNTTKSVKAIKLGSSDNHGRSTKADSIPGFPRAWWTTSFLPTLYDSLCCSEKPFQDFQKGEHTMKRLQGIVDLVYPDSEYCVKWGDEFCQTVRSIGNFS